ncbi:MAG TPA: type IV secretion system protein, partial [Fibrobacteria bacterium]|nr:type IV secretion system protein [Fibrobacteria bacterium]
MAVDQQYVLSSYRRAFAELGDVESMWNPFQLIYVAQGNAQINQWATFISSMVRIGAAVLVVMALLRLISILMDELHNVPASTAIIGVLLEMGFCGAILYNYTWFAELLPDIFHRLTRAIYSGYDRALLRDVADGLSVAALEKTSENKWHSLNLAMASIPQFISALVTALATCLLWVVSKYQAVLYTFWYLIGPFLIPFYLFRPFRSVAVGWFRSLLGAAFMGVVGSILFILLQRSGWIMNAFASGHNGSYITSLVFGLCCLFLIFSIPSLSQSIWNGISASLSRGAYATSSALASGIGAGVAVAGGAAVAGGLSARGLG